MLGIRDFRKYKVWNDAVGFAVKIYQLTKDLPWFEKKGLCDQLQRASVSISSNIAEGAAKPSDADFVRYLHIALGSTYEVETQLLIANKVGYMDDELYADLSNDVRDIERQLTSLIKKVEKEK